MGDAHALFGRWQELLKTGGVDIKGAATHETHHVTKEQYWQVIITQDDGKVMQAKEFLLEQPQVYNFRTNDVDYWPDGVEPPPPPAPVSRKKRKNSNDGRRKKNKGRKRRRR